DTMACMRRSIALAFLLVSAAAGAQDVVREVRAAIGKGDLEGAYKLVRTQVDAGEITPELAEAFSWVARGALAAKRIDEAQTYADDTRKMVTEQLKNRKLDAEPHLPLALGAAIEVEA